jgi:hypothetical protein
MRVELELSRDGDGHLEGRVMADLAAPQSFSGILELLRILEDLEDGAAAQPISPC